MVHRRTVVSEFFSIFERILYVYMEFYIVILVVRVVCNFLSVVYAPLLTLFVLAYLSSFFVNAILKCRLLSVSRNVKGK